MMLNDEMIRILDNLFEGAYIVDKERKILYWNKGSENISGYTSEEVVNNYCYQNILRHVDDNGVSLCVHGCPLDHTLRTGIKNENKVYLHHKKGHRVPITVRTEPIYNEDGEIVAALEVFSDERLRKEMIRENRKLKKLVVTDELTGMYNRRYTDLKIKNFISEFNEFKQPFGILFVDVDHFKNVNDTYGHNVGDEILKLVTSTIYSNIRTDDIVGRWGGEEFIVVGSIDSNENLGKFAKKIKLLVERSAHRLENGEDLRVTVSIGGTMYLEGESVEEMIERADKAMYTSKETGRNKYTII